jgi:hypothetical protein
VQLSLCEVEVDPKGPSGVIDIATSVGSPFDIYLQGIGMDPEGDRVVIVRSNHISRESAWIQKAIGWLL